MTRSQLTPYPTVKSFQLLLEDQEEDNTVVKVLVRAIRLKNKKRKK